MSKRILLVLTGFLAGIVFILTAGQANGQQMESQPARILINNLPDTVPPLIRLISPEINDGTTLTTSENEMDLIGEATDENGIKFITVNSDVRSVNQKGVFSTGIKLNPGKNQVRIVAADNEGNLRDWTATFIYVPPVVTLADRIQKESKYYGLIIGIDHYADINLPELSNPISDAEKLYQALLSEYSFSKENVTLLKDATRNDIIFALDSLSRKVTPEDNVLIFYAGHGMWDENSSVGYWLPSDAYLNTTANWFRNSTLVDYLKTIHSKHTLLIADACFAGSIFQSRSAFPQSDRAFELLYDMPSRKAMTSGTYTEVPDRSSFTRYLIQRLKENKETYLSSEQLFSSFRIAVINNSDAVPMFGEIRNVGDEGGDFIFLKK
jgi:hypothetical protein